MKLACPNCKKTHGDWYISVDLVCQGFIDFRGAPSFYSNPPESEIHTVKIKEIECKQCGFSMEIEGEVIYPFQATHEEKVRFIQGVLDRGRAGSTQTDKADKPCVNLSEELEKRGERIGQKMLYLKGKAFRCDCGGNVFTHFRWKGRNYYRCNACHTIYEGE